MTAIVFENAQGEPENLDGVTVGVAVLALDDFATDLIGSMHYLSEVTTLWEVTGGSYARDTIGLSYAIESGDGVLRYASGVPTFDLAGIDPVNAVVFYNTAGADDDAHELLFALSVAEGAGFDGWTANGPTDGLWRIARTAGTVPPGGNVGDALLKASSTDGDTEWGPVAGTALPDHGVQLILAADAVDGTGDEFTLLLADPSAAGGGIVPAGWFAGSVFDSSGIGPTFDAAGFGSFLTAVGLGAGATVLVHQGSGATLRSVTAATVGDPWPLVAASARVTGTLFALYIFAEVVDGEIRLLNKLSAEGVLRGLTSTDMALLWAEGHVYDFPRHGSTYFLAPVSSTLFAGSVADIDQPVGDDGVQVAKGDHVLTAGDLDADGNHYIAHVHPTTGQWGWVPSVGTAVPSGAGAWSNAITTNQIDSGFTFYGDESIVIFRGYRSGTTISGQPANATRPLRTGEWVVYSSGGGGGSGDVVGPASATADHFAVFDGTSGELIKDGGAKGTAAALNVAAAGDAASGEVVKGNDTRLTDDRDPTAHKTSHAIGGADVLSPTDIGATPASLGRHVFAAGEITPVLRGVSTNLTMVLDRLYLGAVLDLTEERTFARVYILHSSGVSTTGTIRIGAWSPAASNGKPSALHTDFGTADPTTAAGSFKGPSGSWTLPAGRYYLGCVAQFTGTPPVLAGVSNTFMTVYPDSAGAPNVQPIQAGVTGSLPNPAVPTANVSTMPNIFLRMA